MGGESLLRFEEGEHLAPMTENRCRTRDMELLDCGINGLLSTFAHRAPSPCQ